MKRLFIVLPLSLCLAMPACKKVKGPANGNSVQPNNNLDTMVSMTAVINGRSWGTTSAYGYNVKHSGNDSGVMNLMITATQNVNDTTSTITFNINNYSGPATYTIDPPYNTAVYYTGNRRHYSDTGVIVIATNTNYALRGTFFFRADTFTVASGKFDVALP